MACQKTVTGVILAFVVCFILVLVPGVTVSAQDADSTVYDSYSGLIGFSTNVNMLYLTEVNEPTNSTDRTFLLYKGNTPTYISFTQEAGMTYNGYIEKWVDFVCPANDTVDWMYAPTVYATDIVTPDGITVSLRMTQQSALHVRAIYTVQFSNYVAAYDGTYQLYLLTNMQFAQTVNSGVSATGAFYYNINPIEDYTGDLYEYREYGDSPGVDGTLIGQNQQIIVENQQANELQEDANTLQEEANTLQEEANTLQEEANATSKNIFEKITDFFDNFFTRLGDFLLGLIVPSADDITAFLGEVNDWFGERLGFIWYPFSFAVDAVAALAGGEADTGITVPALTLNMFGGTYTIWNEMQVDLDAFGIFRYVRLFTSCICVGGIVALAYNKWDEWIGGHGVG